MAQQDMTIVGHLSELRKRIIVSLATVAIMTGISLAVITHLYAYLVHPLTKSGYRLMVTAPGEVITVYLTISGMIGIGLSLPVLLWQVWLFFRPALRPLEQRYSVRLLPVAFLMFILGVVFAWELIFPTILHFLLKISAQQFNVLIRAKSYFSFLANICIPFGFIFELPIVVIFLTQIGLVTPRVLHRARRFAYLIIVLIGVLISPPELVSHLSVVLPMIALYEISIGLCAIVYRRRNKRMQAAESDNEEAS